MNRLNLFLMLTFPIAGAATAALSQDAGGVQLALNNTEQVDVACRLTFTVENGTSERIASLVYETVFFDREGAVSALTLFDFREVPEDTLRVRQFDLAETACDSIGSMLLNGVAACRVGDAEVDTCANQTALTSRTAIEVLR